MSTKVKKIFLVFLCLLLIFQQAGFSQVAAELNIAGHLSSLHSSLISDTFRPLHLRYLSYNPTDNNFGLLLDKGDIKNLRTNELENASKELMQYFLIGLTLPNDTFWVNLRPDSPNQIIDDRLAQTDIGKIMLETDLQLKKDTASFTSPQTPEGREYWDKLYKKASELYGTDTVTIPTLTRPWIVPGEIIIRETTDSAYIYKATLKVMLEQDYLANSRTNELANYSFPDQRSRALNEYSTQLIRELIIPKLTKEVNSSKRYAGLRQVYYSLILAQWFKARYKKGLSPTSPPTNQWREGTVPELIDKQDLTNLTSKEDWSKTTYFNSYKQSFAEGEYNIQEPHYTPTGQVIRSYMSGGEVLNIAAVSPVMTVIPAIGASSALNRRDFIRITVATLASGLLGVVDPEVILGGQNNNNSKIPSFLNKNKVHLLASYELEIPGKKIRIYFIVHKKGVSASDPEVGTRCRDNNIIFNVGNVRKTLNSYRNNSIPSHANLPGRYKFLSNLFRGMTYQEVFKFITMDGVFHELSHQLIDEIIKEDRVTDELGSAISNANIPEEVLREDSANIMHETGGYLGQIINSSKPEYGLDLVNTIASQDNLQKTIPQHYIFATRMLAKNLQNIKEADRPALFRKYFGQEINPRFQEDIVNKIDIIAAEAIKAYNEYMVGSSPVTDTLLPAAGSAVENKSSLVEEEPPYIMKHARDTDYNVEDMLDRTFDKLNEYYDNQLEMILRQLIQDKKDGPLKVLFIGVGRGNEVIGAKRLFGDALEAHSINRGRREFYDESSFMESLGKADAATQERELRIFHSVKNNLSIVNLNEKMLDYKNNKFDVVVFCRAVTVYLRDKIGVINRLLESLCQEEGYLFARAPYTEVRDQADKKRSFIDYLDQLWRGNNNLSILGPKGTFRIQKRGGYKIPLDFIDAVGIPFDGVDIDQFYSIYKMMENPGPEFLKSSSSISGKNKDYNIDRIGGIDFRSLPIVTQAVSNLSAGISSSALMRLSNVNLNAEWQQIERMSSSGIKPSPERIREYAQASSALGKISQDKDKIILCISGILRQEEENCCETDPLLRDILVVLESVQQPQELKKAFLGKV